MRHAPDEDGVVQVRLHPQNLILSDLTITRHSAVIAIVRKRGGLGWQGEWHFGSLKSRAHFANGISGYLLCVYLKPN